MLGLREMLSFWSSRPAGPQRTKCKPRLPLVSPKERNETLPNKDYSDLPGRQILATLALKIVAQGSLRLHLMAFRDNCSLSAAATAASNPVSLTPICFLRSASINSSRCFERLTIWARTSRRSARRFSTSCFLASGVRRR